MLTVDHYARIRRAYFRYSEHGNHVAELCPAQVLLARPAWSISDTLLEAGFFLLDDTRQPSNIVSCVTGARVW